MNILPPLRLALACALLLPLCACSLAPKYARPDSRFPDSFAASDRPKADLATVTAAERAWWREFNSSALTLLQEEALRNNHDFAAARWVLAQSLSQARASRADLFPSLDMGGSGSRRGRASQGGYSVSDAVSGTAQASYELDLWSKNADSARAADFQATASLNAWRGAGLSLESEVALTYFSYLAAKENLAVYDSILDNARAVLAYLEKRERLGAAPPLDVVRQRGSVRSMEAERINHDLKMREARNTLCLLLGATTLSPRLDALIEQEKMRHLTPPPVRAGLPSELLARRPDIAEAEAGLQAANANIGVARSAFLPSITLTASAGWESDALSTLISPASALYSLAGSILQPIFQGGKLLARHDEAVARQRELVERYRQTTLSAFWEVSTALEAVALLQSQEEHRKQSAGQAAEAYRIARARYEKGAEDFLAVLAAQETLLSSDNSLIQTRLERLNSAVTLFKALGGGWGKG